MKISSIQKVIYLMFFATILYGCAKIVAPTGGPKDKEHPLIVESDPPFNSVNFESDQINITFNEFIQLKDLNNNLIISPPVEKKPIVRVKGKTLNIKFEEDLEDSTTYNINFGNSVQDYNEGNPIENFQYVLSTDTYIDSLSAEGTVLNAFSLKPEEGVFVMLYTSFEDSVPFQQVPKYLSKTNKEGFFRINNISHSNYKLFCVRDFNRNYLFDLPNEEIAFTDSLLSFDLITKTETDTIFKSDTLSENKTSLMIDSINSVLNREVDTIITRTRSFYPVHNYIFRLFMEDSDVQYLANYKRESKQKIEILLNKSAKDSIVLSLVDTTINNSWFLREASSDLDSVIYWLTDTALYNAENLLTTFSYYKEDSNLVFQWVTDTIKFRYFEPTKRKREEDEKVFLKYSLNVKNRATLDLNNKINFSFETPVGHIDTAAIKLFAKVDSLEFSIDYSLTSDSLKMRKINMDVDWSEDTVYRLEIYPGAFTDIYELSNDTSIIEIKTQKRDFYGKILADITGTDSSFQVICQLVVPGKEGEKIIKETTINSDQIVEFDYLPPKEFIFKVILDTNFNNKWDTGEYLKNIQPEEVLYHIEKIKVRSNWDIEINLDVKKQ
ncbi:MAG: Ig-like domain-containing protein [Bacteroidales bacterium]|nr:Ig-like domain-containing protein [Bacteroidales bacterium]